MKNIRFHFLLLVVSLFCWRLGVTSAHAEWSTDPSTNTPITTAAGAQYSHAMASDGAGGAIITWQDDRLGSGYLIYAQRINAAGVIQWHDSVAICAAGGQYGPQIVSDGVGGAIITWYDFRNGSNYDIYAQRINGAGVVQWQTNGVAIHTGARTQWWPAIVTDGESGAIIAWEDVNALDTEDIHAQRIDSAGVVRWDADGVPICTEAAGQEQPTAISDGAGGAIIVWMDERTGGNNIGDVYAQRINGAGVVQWTANGAPVCTATGPQRIPTIVSDDVNGAIITWVDLRDVNNPDIYAQRITGIGTTQWTTDGVVVTSAVNSQNFPAMVSDGNSGAIITWEDSREGFLNTDIYAQRINATGIAEWTANGVPLCTAADLQSIPAIMNAGGNGAIVAWEDRRNPSDPNLYAQRIAEDGSMQWATDGVAISTASGYQAFPEVISDGNGGAITAWRDDRNAVSFWDIYAQQVNANGNIGVVTDIAEQPTSVLAFALRQNYPNPFNPATTISFVLPSTSLVSLKIFDALGREVSVLLAEELPAGMYTRQWNAAALPSGVYFYRLQAGSFAETKKLMLLR